MRQLRERGLPLPPRLHVFAARRRQRTAGEQHVGDGSDALAIPADRAIGGQRRAAMSSSVAAAIRSPAVRSAAYDVNTSSAI